MMTVKALAASHQQSVLECLQLLRLLQRFALTALEAEVGVELEAAEAAIHTLTANRTPCLTCC
jgi:hypothetical protein